MLEYVVRCFGWSALAVSVCCVWNSQPVYGIYLILMALVLLNMEFEGDEQNIGEMVDIVKMVKDG